MLSADIALANFPALAAQNDHHPCRPPHLTPFPYTHLLLYYVSCYRLVGGIKCYGVPTDQVVPLNP